MRTRSISATALAAVALALLPAVAAPRAADAATTSAAATTVTSATSAGSTSTTGAKATASTTARTASTSTANPETPIPVPDSNVPPAGRRLSADQVIAIASALPKMRAVRRKYPGSYPGAYLKVPFHWQVSFFSRDGKREIGQVTIADLTGKVLEQWTGFQVAWTMARGYPGAFGRHVNALYIWLPLCVLFLVPFVNPRRLLSLLHLDLLVLLSFSISLAFFNHAHIYASVPLAYPPLLYLLARMLALLRRDRPGRHRRARGPLRLLVPTRWLAIGVVFLLGFRIALNVTDSNVIDVGYAGVIGAQRIADGRPLYGSFPFNNEHGDTYGPVNYEAYVPFEQVFGWSGTWDDLPAAHAAAIFFDLLAVALLYWLGRRLRGPTLGIALAYAWVSFPFTLFALDSNSNDILVAALVLAALLAATYTSDLARAGRGAMAALAGLTKFAPLALAPLLATHEIETMGTRTSRVRALGVFGIGLALTAAIASIPALSHDSLHEIYTRTLVYQSNRGSPFSVWGLYGLHGEEIAVEALAVALALALAVLPRRPDVIGLTAACAAVIIAEQLGIEHWFYLYIPWFFPLVMVALLGRFSEPAPSAPDVASAPARSSRPAAALSS
jgi:hypothetical protein